MLQLKNKFKIIIVNIAVGSFSYSNLFGTHIDENIWLWYYQQRWTIQLSNRPYEL